MSGRHAKQFVRRYFSVRRAIAILAIVTGGLVGLWAATSSATSPDANTAQIEQQLQTFASTLGQLASVPTSAESDPLHALTSKLPFTDFDPFGSGGLSLGDVFTQAFDSTSLDSPGDLATALDGVNTTMADGVHVVLGCGDSAQNCSHVTITPTDANLTGPYDISIPFRAYRDVTSHQFSLDTDLTHFAGGALTIHAEISATFAFHFDPSAADPGLRFALTNHPSMTASVDVSNSPLTFGADLGITKVSASVPATTPQSPLVHLSATLALQSPHPDGTPLAGEITTYDMQHTGLSDLVTVTTGGSVNGHVDLDTTLTPASPDASIDITDPDLSDGFQTHFSSGGNSSTSFKSLVSSLSLSDFTNVSPSQLLAGLGQLAASIQGLQQSADVHLPFMQGGVANTLQFITELIQMLSQQTVTCGTQNTNPPSGDLVGLPSGTTVYCSATTTDSPNGGSISWQSVGGTATAGANTSGTDADGTIAASPNKTAVFTTTTDFVPPVIVASYTTGSSPVVTKGVSEPVPTVQELFDELKSKAHFDTAENGGTDLSFSDAVKYDATTHILTIRLTRKLGSGVAAATSFDFADHLKSSTGLFSLSPDSTASASINAGAGTIDLTLGVVLSANPTISPIGDTPSFLDRFFIEKPDSGHVLSIDDANVTADVKLDGQVGFLGVTAEGASVTDNGTTHPAFQISKDDSSKPILSLDMIDHPDGGSGDPAEPFSMTVDGQPVANALPIPVLLPHITKHVDVTPNFKLEGGLDVKASVGSQTLTEGHLWFDWPVDSVDELLHATNLQVHAQSDFTDQLQKFWEMAKNDPSALLNTILTALENLADQAQTTNGSSGSVFDTQLPLVNETPRDLLKQFKKIKQVVDELKGVPGPAITCTDTTAHVPAVDANDAKAGDTITCHVQTAESGTHVTWLVDAQQAPITASGVADSTVGPSPTDITFTIPTTGNAVDGVVREGNPNGYFAHVEFDTSDGHHVADFPAPGTPQTLQQLADLLNEKLGLPQGMLTLAIDTSAHANGSATQVPVLKFGLRYDLCTRDNDKLPSGVCDGATGGGNLIDTPQFPLNLDVPGLGSSGLALTSAQPVQLQFQAHAQIDLGFPLNITSGQLPTPVVFGSTGAGVQAVVDVQGVGLQAALGPLSLQLGQYAPGDDSSHTAQQGTGNLYLAGRVAVDPPSGADADTYYTPSDFLSGINAHFTNLTDAQNNPLDPHSCGTMPGTNSTVGTLPSGHDPTDMSGQVCGFLSLGLSDTWLGDLGFFWDGFGGAPVFSYPSDLASKLASLAFDPDFLLKALSAMLDQVETSLRGGGTGSKLPVIGDAMDAGADIVGNLNHNVVEPVQNGLDAVIGAVGTPAELTDKVDQFMFDHLGPNGANVLLDKNNDGLDKNDVGLTLYCGSDMHVCTGTDGLTDIKDARFDFWIGQGIGTTGSGDIKDCAAASPSNDCTNPVNLPFDIGLDGFPLRVTGAVAPHVGWKMHLDFGLSRDLGPYLVVNHSDDDVQVGAAVTLGSSQSSCGDYGSVYSHVNGAFDHYQTANNGNRCMQGTLTFLQVNVRDADGQGNSPPTTGVRLVAGVHLSDKTDSNTANKKLRLTDITNLSASFKVNATADANLLVRAGVAGSDSSGFPSVFGVFSAHWQWGAGVSVNGGANQAQAASADSATPSSIDFSDLYLDGGQFLSKFLAPIAQQVQQVTSPLKPIIDTLQAPIPVVSQLAGLVGKPPVTLIDLAEAASGTDLSVVKSVIDFLHWVNTFSFDGTSDLYIPLGGNNTGGFFNIDPHAVEKPQLPTTAGSLVVKDQTMKSSDFTSQLPGANATPTDPPTDGRVSTFGVPGLNIPLIHDPSQIFQLLMGSDITLVDYQFGGLHAQAGFQYSFGPFMVGPVPVSVIIGGSVTVNGHLGIGYDTTGLREVIGGANAGHLLDGLFFDTYDSHGQETPVVQLIGTVTAGAAVDLVIVKAGIEAGLQLTVNFYFDDPTPDGKMSLTDIGQKLNNPICLFKVNGSLDAFIKAFVEFYYFIGSTRVDFTILKLHLLDFSAACTPPSPEPATVVNHGDSMTVGSRSVGGNTLVLNIGPRAGARNINTDAKDEKIVVRALPPNNPQHKQFSVTIFGAYKEYGNTDSNAADHVTSIFADGGDGQDDIELQDGAQSDGSPDANNGVLQPDASESGCTTSKPCIVHILTPATIYGGTGNDTVIGGWAGDHLYGEDGNDNLAGAGGDDYLYGGGGADTMTGDRGDDHIYAGDVNGSTFTPGSGPASIQGGPGADHIYGSDGTDVLDGGPGLNPAAADPDHPNQTYAQTQPDGLDGNDVIVGEKGADNINGGPGDDIISGDEDLSSDTSCTQDGQALSQSDISAGVSDNDTIDAGPGNDHVWGGQGDDQIKGVDGDNWLCGNAGNDVIDSNPPTGSASDVSTGIGGPGNDTLTGGPGASLLIGGDGNDTIIGGAGNDIAIGGFGRDRISTGDGQDVVLGDTGTVNGDDAAAMAQLSDSALHNLVTTIAGDSVSQADAIVVDGGAGGNDSVDCTQPIDSQQGNADCISGGGGQDVIFAGGANDVATGDTGNDYVHGGNGKDYLRGGQQDDYVYGDNGNDTVYGDSGADHLYGGADQDVIYGGTENDYIEGNDGADIINGDAGDDAILGGSGTAASADGNAVPADPNVDTNPRGDTIQGGEGNDVVVGDNGSISGFGGSAIVHVFDNNAAPADGYYGDDYIYGNVGTDRLYGGGGTDTVHGNEDGDYIEGNNGADQLYGDAGADHIIGGSSENASTANDGGDHVYGNADDDVVIGDNGTINADGTTAMAASAAGTYGDDYLYGGDANDRLYGEQGADHMWGDGTAMGAGDGADYLVGDLGSIVPSLGGGSWPGGAPKYDVTLIAPETGDADTMYGGAGDDHMYGGAADDTMSGDAGDDHLEGNAGSDSMYGLTATYDTAGRTGADQAEAAAGSDQDDLIGGSSSVNPESDRQDAGETVMDGGPGVDVLIGDNGEITRSLNGNAWANDPVTGGAARAVTLFYEDRADCSTGVCGGDRMTGGDGNDKLYGEGGNDTIAGDTDNGFVLSPPQADPASMNPGDDYVEGNQGSDTVHGNGGQDDIIGGSADIASGQVSDQTAVGEPDDADVIDGGNGADVVLGDNGRVLRTGLTGAGTVTGTLEDVTKGRAMSQRTIALYDLGDSTAGTFGGDTVTGGAGDDVVFGESGNDNVSGGDGNDYVEGNQGQDTVSGDAGEDDIIGGSSTIASTAQPVLNPDQSATGEPDRGAAGTNTGDTLSGGGDNDVVLGDNGRVLRIGTTGAATITGTLEDVTKGRGMTQRAIWLYDLGNGYAYPAATSANDLVTGDDGVDVLFGEGGNDRMKGNAGQDYLEGGQGSDALEGNDGDDDIVGGSSVPLTNPPAGSPDAGQPDQADEVYGGAGDDVVTGDNAVLLRIGSRSPVTNRIGTAAPGTLDTARHVTLLDLTNGGGYLTAPTAARFGGDVLSGGQGVDVLYGQDGNDTISGGPDDDYAEGNGGNDVIRGDLLADGNGPLMDDVPNDHTTGQPQPPSPETTATLLATAWPGSRSSGTDLEGPAGADGQDDLIGGSAITGFRDGNDTIEGDGNADFTLGDNGTLVRTVVGSPGSYANPTYTARDADGSLTYVRHGAAGETAPTRDCTTTGHASTCDAAGASGDDTLFGDGGADTMWGQDGNDTMRGGAGNDDMYGEMGDDTMYGDAGEDAMAGDRGGFVDTLQSAPGATISVTSPPALQYTAFAGHPYDRRFDLQHDIAGAAFVGNAIVLNGDANGGNDTMRGGPDHDVMAGGYGDDLMNGDSGGDTLFGGNGSDVMWGGRGCDPALDAATPDCQTGGTFDPNARGTNDRMVDYEFAGAGSSLAADAAGVLSADVVDWKPRSTFANCVEQQWPTTVGLVTEDPCNWYRMVGMDDDAFAPGTTDNQHHQGIDWLYGGWDRDILQGDVTDNGPNPGDRLLDWSGTYNLYTHCNAAYGGFNDVRVLNPADIDFLNQLAYFSGAGQTADDVTTRGTSAFIEVAMVYTKDLKSKGTGSPYPSTPAHFDDPVSCGGD